ncbi:hypothetical protein MVG78_01505 [Roseomonas gilardii subsp. gilardii]|uniref:hypothetical protein n=1 Tax=Roseomonas gilardii TaxID=257708 RepID=UPI001FF8C26E|nr:hypothetical protein [Roseomonas gilardii]UPG72902.1 hypothetical protein MVG78_01505 [Roseomonas gilardii subsp. gilardii]
MPKIDSLLERTYGSPEVIIATGTPAARFQQRFKESDLLDVLSPGVRIGGRRQFHLSDIYLLRLVEALAGQNRLDVKPAIAILRELLGHDLGGTYDYRALFGETLSKDEFSKIHVLRHRHPSEWPAEWHDRNDRNAQPKDFPAQHWLVARKYPFGWRTAVGRDVSGAIGSLPHPAPGSEGEPDSSLAIIVNMTAELSRVDNALAEMSDD